MTSATLYREGPDLDALLAELDAQYPGQVRVIDVLHPREGGVLGFFARQRVGVHYRLIDGPPTSGAVPPPHLQPPHLEPPHLEPAPAEPAHPDPAHPDPAHVKSAHLDPARAEPALPRAAGTRSAARRPAAVDPGDRPDSAGAEFAWLLAELALRKATERRPAGPVADTAPSAVAETAPSPTAGTARHATRLALRRQLVEMGVPIDLVPADAPHAYAAIEDLTGRLPTPPVPPAGPGQILVVAGPADGVRVTAEAVVAGASIDPDRVWAHRGPADLVPARRVIASAAEARSVAAEIRRDANGPTLVVVATGDEPAWGDSPADVIAALAPDALWAIVDATCKPADTRRALDRLGPPTALVVVNADRTTSPATIWELGVPIAMLGDRPSSGPAWAVLLLEALAQLERACSAVRR